MKENLSQINQYKVKYSSFEHTFLSFYAAKKNTPIGKFRPTVMGFAESAQLDDF